MNDPFFTKKVCDRCPEDLSIRRQSWFNDDVLCLKCSNKEDDIKKKLTQQGKNTKDFEGCGFIPNVENSSRFIKEK
jgi:hypothetical protein